MQISIANIIRGTLIGNTMSVLTRYISRVVNGGGIVEAPQCVETALNSQPLLGQASLVLIPSGYKEDVVYSQIPTNGSGDLSFTRASNGTRINSAGLVEVVPWNLLTYSEEFSNGVYTKVATTITSNTTNAPNGTLTADKLVSTSVSSSHLVYQNLGSVGDTRVISCFVKKAEYRYVNLQYGTAFARFDFDTLTFSGGTSNTYTDEGNGWYRISSLLTATVNARATILIPDNSGNVSYVGDDVSGTFVWGFQANIGSTAKPYFPTTDRLNVPRLTYQNGGGGCPSLLLEPQRTNIALRSEEFDNASWAKTLCTITANQIVSPSGYLDADLVTTSGTADTLQQSVSVTSGTAYTFSGFIKSGSIDTISLVVFGSFPTSAGTYNLTNGTATSAAGSPVVSIQDYGNGWYRATVTATATSTGTANFYFASGSTDAVSTYYVWGAQLEAGAYATSYIPTTSSSATRVADACYKTGISSLIGQTEGTIFAEFKYEGVTITPNGDRIISVSDGTSNNRISLFKNLTFGTIYFFVGSGGSTIINEANISGTSIIGGTHKIAAAYKSGDYAVFFDGVLVFSSNAAVVPATTAVFVGSDETGSVKPLSGGINQALLFKTRLTNAELAQLTGNQNYTINQAYASYGVASESPNCVQP